MNRRSFLFRSAGIAALPLVPQSWLAAPAVAASSSTATTTAAATAGGGASTVFAGSELARKMFGRMVFEEVRRRNSFSERLVGPRGVIREQT